MPSSLTTSECAPSTSEPVLTSASVDNSSESTECASESILTSVTVEPTSESLPSSVPSELTSDQFASSSPNSRCSSPSMSASTCSLSSLSCDDEERESDIATPIASSEDVIPDADRLFNPLYPGAEITLCGALCAIMQFCSRNKLTYSAIGELLQLLHVLCPPSQLPKTFYLFKKFFDNFSQDHIHQGVCLQCKKSGCSCGTASFNGSAHLVNVDVTRSLKAIVSST